jgi:hypothetical protein
VDPPVAGGVPLQESALDNRAGFRIPGRFQQCGDGSRKCPFVPNCVRSCRSEHRVSWGPQHWGVDPARRVERSRLALIAPAGDCSAGCGRE